MAKERIDVLLVQKGFYSSREQAKRAVMAGIIRDDYDIIDKPGTKIDVNSNLFVKGDTMPYVSRGGLKLEKALQSFSVAVEGKVVADIGSSTGGFSDCALQNGAKMVYAIDVGTNQLVWKLRNDPRVIVKEKTNFRYATKELFSKEIPNFACIDVSFISLVHIFTPLAQIVDKGTPVIALIKPQFEAGKEAVGKKGIVRDAKVHIDVINKVRSFSQKANFILEKLTYSPITGGEGNIEFLGLFVKDGNVIPIDVERVVNEAHLSLKG